jgi:phage tail-like protein
MDQVLALFEGHITEIDQRLEKMRHLFSAKVCPPEALEWLASFVALTFDSRLKESVKRQLLIDMTRLYRQRGTLPGLVRLLSIIAEAKVTIIEGYRLRGHQAAFIGASGIERIDIGRSVIGHDLRLGGYESGPGTETRWEPWEIELMQNYRQNKQHWELQNQIFDQSSISSDTPCPEREPQQPIDPDPFVAFHRRYAHRFSVLVFREKDEKLADIMEQAIESNKPAHTLHRLCWLDAGFRLGSNTYLEIGTKITKAEDFRPPLLDHATLAGQNILG